MRGTNEKAQCVAALSQKSVTRGSGPARQFSMGHSPAQWGQREIGQLRQEHRQHLIKG